MRGQFKCESLHAEILLRSKHSDATHFRFIWFKNKQQPVNWSSDKRDKVSYQISKRDMRCKLQHLWTWPQNIHTLSSKTQSPPPLCWHLTSLTFRASSVYKSLKEKSKGRWRDLRQEPIEDGYICIEVAAKQASLELHGCCALRCYISVCFSISRGNIMLTSEGKSTEMENSCHRGLVGLIYWICPLLLVLDGIHDYLITHLKASRIYGSESSTVQHVWRSTCKQSMKSQKIHVHHLYMSIWGICTWSFYNISM